MYLPLILDFSELNDVKGGDKPPTGYSGIIGCGCHGGGGSVNNEDVESEY